MESRDCAVGDLPSPLCIVVLAFLECAQLWCRHSSPAAEHNAEPAGMAAHQFRGHVLGQQVRWVVRAGHLDDVELIVPHLLLYPQELSRNMAQLAEALALHDAQGC